jgi:shikimate 5-dehydrogenase
MPKFSRWICRATTSIWEARRPRVVNFTVESYVALLHLAIGMHAEDPLPLDATRIDGGAIVADVIVKPTRLLQLAAARGSRTFGGAGMMDHQLQAMAIHLGLGELDFSAAIVESVASQMLD